MRNRKRHTRPLHITAGLATVLLLGLLDYLSGPETSLAICYLVPIVQVTWFGGPVAGAGAALASGAVWLLGELALRRFQAPPPIPTWNIALTVLLFLAVSLGLSAFRRRLGLERGAADEAPAGMADPARFREIVQVEKDRALRYAHPLTLGRVEVDGWGKLVSRLGRRGASAVLQTATTVIRQNTRSSDTIVPLGEGALGILLVEAGPEEIQTIVMRTRQRLLAAMKDHGWAATFSFGVVTFQRPASAVDEMVRMVDALLEAARGEGPDSVRFEVHSD